MLSTMLRPKTIYHPVETKPALNAMQVAASAVLAMANPESRDANWSTACGVALVAAGVFVIV